VKVLKSDRGNQSRIDQALLDLAEICERGRKSGRPSANPWLNGDAWQNAYLALAARIPSGAIDIDRPLDGLAYTTARNFFLSECRRLRRFSELSDEHVHRLDTSEERAPEEWAEASRQGEVLRGGVTALFAAGRLSRVDLAILIGRYVDEWSSKEVADVAGISVDNVRQICARRCRLLRGELAGRGLDEAIA
jgi:DNA-directed RNA polymerase specialized sigma24 family protein